MNLISWQTYLRRYNPKRYCQNDGMFPQISSIHPTLIGAGFQPIGEDEYWSRREPKKPKERAEEIVRSWLSYQIMPPTNPLYVYYVHDGSRINSMPLVVHVYCLAVDPKTKCTQEGGKP